MDRGIRGLYAIADAGVLAARRIELRSFAEQLLAARVETVQWRCKNRSPQEVLEGAGILREVLADSGCRLILNDRVDLALLAGFSGVHVGQEDLSPEQARRIGGDDFLIGISTHAEEQLRAAEAGVANYVAIGPVFRTGTKTDAAEVVGLDGVRRARELTRKPIVAIGGITRENAASVRAAGADAVAVISGLIVAGETVMEVARDFLAIFR